jgi:hypothetical protein
MLTSIKSGFYQTLKRRLGNNPPLRMVGVPLIEALKE